MTLVGAGHSIRGALASGHDRRVAVLRIRVGPRHPRRIGDLACRSTMDRQVMAERRFTPPWDIEDNGSCFIIRDNNGQALSYYD